MQGGVSKKSNGAASRSNASGLIEHPLKALLGAVLSDEIDLLSWLIFEGFE